MYSFIVNPNSRSGEGRNVWNRLRSIMESQGISYQYFLTEYVGHATVLAEKISAAGTPEDPVTLVTVGGDGTIYEVLTGIRDLSSVIFGFIPVGSGNDFCRSMGLPFDPFEALHSILENDFHGCSCDPSWQPFLPVRHQCGNGLRCCSLPGSPDHPGEKISQPSPYGQTDLSYGGAETVSLPHPVFGYGNL